MPMFVLSSLAYPLVLAVLALGAGLAVDRVAGGGLAAVLLAPVGAAALIGVVEVSTYVPRVAPALLSGRATFSAYMVLTDSAVHMIGADYLVHHGQAYAHLDLVNSYGQYISNYYAQNYPTGADALLGGSAMLLGVPVIWAMQPFTAFVLATMAGPCLLLARRMGLTGGVAVIAAVIASVPA